MKLVKKIIAYGIAIIIVVVLGVVIEEQFESNEQVAVFLTGTIFALSGLWLMFRPKSAMRSYRKSQETWHRRHPNLTKALEDVGDVDKELSDAVYSSRTGTRILGFLAFLLGLAAILAALFLA